MIFLVSVAAAATGDALATLTPPKPCTADEDCLMDPVAFRCLSTDSSGASGLPCTLDYGYNTTGICACSAEPCVPLSSSPPRTKLPQVLVIGDSISNGYTGRVAKLLVNTHEVVHVPGNAGNTNWGSRCLRGWLGPDASRWDVITYNAGLHDLAFPDNEHVSLTTYTGLLRNVTAQLAQFAPSARALWVSTTPVPSDPPSNCTLIPHRAEKDVLAYNAAAAKVIKAAGLPTCDLHAVITSECGTGYSSCSIAQCKGPHFTEQGFQLLANAVANCIKKQTH